MTHVVHLQEHFGPFLADGMLANQFRSLHIEAVWDRCDHVVFDLEGVFNMTDSFAFALFGNLAEEHPHDFRAKVTFIHCTETVKSFIAAAIASALSQTLEK